MAADPAAVPAWRVSLALLIAIAVTTGGLHVLFDDQAWWLVVFFVLAAVLGAAATARALVANRFVPTIAATAVLVVLLSLLFAPGSSLLGVIPTLSTIDAFAGQVGAAADSIYRQAIPASAEAPIVFVLCAGVGVVALVCDLVAVALSRPALAGIPLLVILAIPAATARDVTDLFVFALAAAAFLLLLMTGSARRQPGLAVGIGAAAIVGALVAPAALPSVGDSGGAAASGLSTGINPVLTLGDDLRRSVDREVLEYSTASGASHYLRLVTLEDFTADEWRPTETEIDNANTIAAFAPPPGLSGDVPTAPETTTIDIGNLSSRWLPLPYPPLAVSGVDRGWFYSSDDFSVASDGDSSRGQDYEVESLLVDPTPEQLLAAGTVVANGFERYLALPEDLPPVILDTAVEVAASAGTNYEKAIVLQEYFRSGEFEYSEDAPVDGGYDGTGMDIIATFLAEKSGYCVHYATSMAAMARTLDIPSRVVLGFLPGSKSPRGAGTDFTVSIHDLHAWPELFFDGIGWVQFEPTPGRGELGDYADVSVAGVPAPTAPDVAAPDAAPTPESAPPADSAPDSGADAGGQQEQAAAWGAIARILLWILVVVGASFVPALVRGGQRALLYRRLLGGSGTAIDAWTEVLRTAVDYRIPVTVTDTPRETAARIASGGAPLAAILEAVETEVYSPAVAGAPGAIVGDLRRLRSALRDAAAPRVRARALLYPASLWRSIAHPLTRHEVVGAARRVDPR